jgi:hypothetical protein
MLRWTHYRVGADDQDENLWLVLVQQAPRHRRVGSIPDLGPDIRAGNGQLGKCRAGRPRPPDHQLLRTRERSHAPQALASLAPTTTVALPDKSLIIVLFLCQSMVSRGLYRGRSVAQPSARVTGWAGGTIPPDTSLLFGAVFGDPAPIGLGERPPESSGIKIPTISRRSGLLPPGVV